MGRYVPVTVIVSPTLKHGVPRGVWAFAAGTITSRRKSVRTSRRQLHCATTRGKALREQKNMSPGDLPKRTGLFRCCPSRLENGHTVLFVDTFERLPKRSESRCTGFSPMTITCEEVQSTGGSHSESCGRLETGRCDAGACKTALADEGKVPWASVSNGVENGESSLTKMRVQFDRSLVVRAGRGVSLTKQESQTRVPSFSVKSILRLRSISASHFPQTS
jgi:hypothetical protein